MSEHEFYAEPTVFDHWQARIGRWWSLHFNGLGAYGWALGFAILGSVFLVTAVVVLAVVLGTTTESALLWNQSFAQTLTVMVGLIAAQTLFRQALVAWPAGIELPRLWRCIGRYIGWQLPVRPAAVELVPRRCPERVQRPVDAQQAIQAFFAGVRAAGVNVVIAKAIFNAGIRSPRHLLRAKDRHLQAIRGVGPATVRKLRAQFSGRDSTPA